MSKAKGVSTQHPDYAAMLPLWDKCDDAAEGEHAVHAAGVKYLPRLREEDDQDYKARLHRTPFFNATWRTISGLKGMLFRKEPVVEVPAAIEPYLLDVDMAGTPLDMFAQGLCEEVLTPGRVGVLVDYPTIEFDGTLTIAQMETMGLRPMMQKYRANEIINWKESRIGNVLMLTLLVLRESAAVQGEDEFSQDAEIQYRVLDLFEGNYRQRLFRVKDQKDEQIGGDIFPLKNSVPLNFIPFVFINMDSMRPKVETPPLLDLAQMNLHHYLVSADFEHACHYSGLPTLFISGYMPEDGQKIYIGGSSAMNLPDPQAKAYYVETGGNFNGPLVANLEAKKAEMAVLGARMLEGQKSAVESAETLTQRSSGEQSQLAGMAQVVSMAITRLLTIFSEWAGATGPVRYEINKDFIPSGLTAQDLTALVGAWQAGAMSGQVLFENLQRGEVIKQGDTYEDEQERIASAPPLLMSDSAEVI